MKPRSIRIRRTLLIGFAVVLFALLSGLLPIHLGPLRGMIEEQVHEATGLHLTIEGAIVARLGPRASVRTGGISLAAPGSTPLLEIDEAYARFALIALARGKVRLHEVKARAILVDYCGDLPEFPATPGSDSEATVPEIAIGRAEIEGLSVSCGKSPPLLTEGSVVASAPAGEAIQIDGSVVLAPVAMPVEFRATGGTIEELLDGTAFPFVLDLEPPQGRLEATGTLELADRVTAAADFEVRIAEPGQLAEQFGLAIPDIAPLDARGNLRADAAALVFEDLSASTGATALLGRGRLDFAEARERIALSLSLALPQLDVAPFMAAEQEPEPGDIDVSPLFDALRGFDADVDLTVDRVLGAPLDITSIAIAATLHNGALDMSTIRADLLGGTVDASGDVDALEECPTLQVSGQASSINLAPLREAELIEIDLSGDLSKLEFNAATCGEEPQQWLDGLTAAVSGSRGDLRIGNDIRFGITEIDGEVRPGEASQVQMKGVFEGEQIVANAKAGSLSELLGAGSWPFTAGVSGAGGRLDASGDARFSDDGLLFDAELSFAAPRAGSLGAWIDVAENANVPLQLGTRLTLDDERLVADAIELKLGSTDVSGTAVWQHAATPDTLELDLASTYVGLDDFDALLPPAVASPDEKPASPGAHGLVHALPPVDLNIAIDAIHGGALDIQDLSLEGRLRAGLVDNAVVRLTLEDELALQGQLDIDVRQSPAKFVFDAGGLNADLGRIMRRLELKGDLQMRVGELALSIESAGDNPRDIVSNASLTADVTEFVWHIPRRQVVSSESETATDTMRVGLDHVAIIARRGQPIDLRSRGEVDGIPVDFRTRAPPLFHLLGDTTELPFNVALSAADDVAIIDLLVDRSDASLTQMRFELSGEVLDANGQDLESLVAPLADYSLAGSLEIGAGSLSLPDIEARLGQSTVSGSLAVAGSGRRHIAIELSSPRLQSDDLSRLPGLIAALSTEETTQLDDPESQDEVIDSAENTGPFIVVNNLISRFQQDYDLDLDVRADDLRVGSDRLGSAELHLSIDEHDFRLAPLSIRLPGGGVSAEYRWALRDGRVDVALSARADALVYGGVLRLVDPESDARGVAYFDVDLAASAAESPEISGVEILLRNANGTVELAAWPENIEAGVLDLWTANLVMALLPTSTDGSQSRLNCVVARLEAKDGVMKPEVSLIDSTVTIIRGRGKFDLARGEIDLLVTPQAKREKFLSASTPITVTGPLNDFEVGLGGGGVLGTLLKWYTSLVYVPYKWLTGERFSVDGTDTCFDAMDWTLTPALEEYFRARDFSVPPPTE